MVSAKDVKELRAITGAGILDCKKALQETNSIEEAIQWLREKGIAKAASKSSRETSEGVISFSPIKDDQITIVEVNCETDFVAKNKEFLQFTKEVASRINDNKGVVDESIQKELDNKTFTIGEKILVSRMETLNAAGKTIGMYLHNNNQVASILLFEGKIEPEVAKGVAMHTSSMAPKYIAPNDVDASFLESEKEIMKAQIDKNKPPQIVEKILEGKVRKRLSEVCLLEQEYVLSEDKKKVKEVIGDSKITRMIRYRVGE